MPDPNHIARLILTQVPEEIRKSISVAELNDRLTEAARLSMQARDPALSAELRKAASIRAQAVLHAQPRQATRRQHQDLIAKAAVAPPAQAAAIRRKAERLIEEDHPIAPARTAAVRKAKADAEAKPVPVFDGDGNLIGIVDPADITPVAGTSGGRSSTTDDPAAPAPVPAVAPVAKSGQVIVYDQWRRRYLADRRSVRTTARRAQPRR
jgi:CBS domain-containing protein